jgi:LysM repeat protein
MTGYKNVVLIVGLAAALAAAGCAKKEMIKQDEPEKAVAAAMPVSEAPVTAKYDVKKGDSLWAIASRDAAYGNAFEWPLLFKANRDQIQDPDLIEANQQLNIQKDFTQVQSEDAIQKAKETPLFKRHSEPRKTLPLMY